MEENRPKTYKVTLADVGIYPNVDHDGKQRFNYCYFVNGGGETWDDQECIGMRYLECNSCNSIVPSNKPGSENDECGSCQGKYTVKYTEEYNKYVDGIYAKHKYIRGVERLEKYIKKTYPLEKGDSVILDDTLHFKYNGKELVCETKTFAMQNVSLKGLINRYRVSTSYKDSKKEWYVFCKNAIGKIQTVKDIGDTFEIFSIYNESLSRKLVSSIPDEAFTEWMKNSGDFRCVVRHRCLNNEKLFRDIFSERLSNYYHNIYFFFFPGGMPKNLKKWVKKQDKDKSHWHDYLRFLQANRQKGEKIYDFEQYGSGWSVTSSVIAKDYKSAKCYLIKDINSHINDKEDRYVISVYQRLRKSKIPYIMPKITKIERGTVTHFKGGDYW